MLGAGAGDALVRVNLYEMPVRLGAGPPLVAGHRRDFHLVQLFADQLTAHAVQIVAEDHPDNFRFFRDNFQSSAFHFVPVNAEEAGFAPLKVVADAPLAVFRNAVAFLLRKRSEDGQHKLTVPAQRIQLLFLKINAYAQPLQLAHRIQQRQRISGETGNGLDQNQVDLSFAAFLQHPLKFRARFLRPGQPKIREYACVLPFGISLDPFAVIADLRRQRVQHGVLFHGDAGIGCHALSHRQLRRCFHAGKRHCLLVHMNPSLRTLYQSIGS